MGDEIMRCGNCKFHTVTEEYWITNVKQYTFAERMKCQGSHCRGSHKGFFKNVMMQEKSALVCDNAKIGVGTCEMMYCSLDVEEAGETRARRERGRGKK